jgi:PAS domain S-box-containing protein
MVPPEDRADDARCPSWLDALAEGCLVLDRDLRALYCNPAFAQALGRPAAELTGRCLPAVLPDFPATACHRLCRDALRTGRPHEADEADGDRFFHLRAHPVPDGVLVLRTDVTPRRQLEEELLQSALQGRIVLEQLPVVHWAVDPDLRFTRSAGAGLLPLGLADGKAVGQSLHEFFRTDDPDYFPIRMHRRALAGRPVRFEFEFSGRHFDVTLEPLRGRDGQVRGVAGLAHDVTDRRRDEEERARLQEQVFQAQKAESLAALACGVAHDFGNIAAAIRNAADLLLRELPDGAPPRALAELIKRAGERASDVTRQMLVYAGKRAPDRRPLDLSTLVRENLPLLTATLPHRVSFQTALADGLPPVHADPGQMHQIVLNLLINAAQAVGRRGGTVRLTTGAAAPGPGVPPPPPGAGGYVFLEVADDGCGMPPEVQARVFDPFFTTKKNGRGLGLSTVQGVVRAHGGALQLASTPGKGTTFRVLLPAGVVGDAS